MLHDFTYMQNLRNVELIGTERKLIIVRSFGKGQGDVGQHLTKTNKYLTHHYHSQALKGISKEQSKMLLTLEPNTSYKAGAGIFQRSRCSPLSTSPRPCFRESESRAQGKIGVRKTVLSFQPVRSSVSTLRAGIVRVAHAGQIEKCFKRNKQYIYGVLIILSIVLSNLILHEFDNRLDMFPFLLWWV